MTGPRTSPADGKTVLPARTLVSQYVPCLGTTEYGEKGQRNFHAATWHWLAVDISRYWASCCAQQPIVSMGGSVPRYRARKNGGHGLHRQKA